MIATLEDYSNPYNYKYFTNDLYIKLWNDAENKMHNRPFEPDFTLPNNEGSRDIPINSMTKVFLKNELTIDTNEPILDLRSEEAKAFIQLNVGLYHWIEVFGTIINIYEQNPQCKFYVRFSEDSCRESEYNMILFLVEFFKDYQIQFEFLNFKESPKYILTNNFFYTRIVRRTDQVEKKIYPYLSKYIKDINLPASKNVYIGRKFQNEPHRYGKNFNLSHPNDIRIYNENLLIDYLEIRGFDIVFAENFSNFKEQINYFYHTKNIFSVTSSALTNCIFMREGSNVIEAVTPIYIADSRLELHGWYHTLAYLKNHNYFSIQNHTRKAEDIIDQLKKTKLLDYILNE